MNTYDVYYRSRGDKTALEFVTTINAKSKIEAQKNVSLEVNPDFVVTKIQKI